jgi:hypothetical protein
MANYQQLTEAYLTHYQPALKAELETAGQLQTFLEEQAEAMQEAKTRVLATLKQRTPGLSSLQLDMEAERTVQEMFLTPF